MTRRDVRAYLFEGIRLIDHILALNSGFDAERFASDQLTQLATERQFISLGEALRALRRDFPAEAAQLPELPQVIAMRNILVHAYRKRDLDIIWLAISNRLHPLRSRLAALLEAAGGDPP